MSDMVSVVQQLYCCDNQSKHSRIPQEVGLVPPISNMKMHFSMKGDPKYRACNPSTISVTFSMDITGSIKTAKFYMYLVNFESPESSHPCGLSTTDQLKSSQYGFVYWADDQLLVGSVSKTININITSQRTMEVVQADIRSINRLLHNNGHSELVQPAEPRQPMSHSVRLKLVCCYSVDSPGGQTWLNMECLSEAFIYKPAPLNVTSVQLQLPDAASPRMMTLKLNRALVNGYDRLLRARLALDGDSPHYMDAALQADQQDCVNVDLPEWVNSAENQSASCHQRSARICLDGSTDGFSWDDSVGWHVEVAVLTPLPARPPSLSQRRQRKYCEDMLDDVM